MSELDLFTTAGDGLAREHFGLTDSGTPYVQAPVFSRAMGYTRTSDALKMLEADEKGTAICRTPGGDQQMSVIYEDGIWELIFRSTLPSAKSIKARVKAILRELRETGVVDNRQKPMTELEMARQYVAALERAAELEPKAKSWETLAEADGDYSLRDAAQILDRDPAITTGQNRLARYLRDVGWCDQGGTPYQAQVDLGRLVRRSRTFEHPRTREQQVTSQVRVTAKGLHELHKRMGGEKPLLTVA
ncbi:hypothetical protein B1813_18830 [Saccharomonospora piscinae]|uniref:Bro-N domain-containing protein n=1 Tax=Saccharomonospora piscinae TaxID=687388 RepID=A0A1V8ZYM4_SACPI|nr:phage antirepressor KilAC domain-containing protein [Saccharomonospora piscinae]OQO89898.1 hypothetical protein B1813_18830 [Saccharomonospora piscinae]